MKIIQLQYFVEVVKHNSISKAAKKFYVSQPAISTAIKALEEEYNTSLFIRYNNHLTLTDEGHHLYALAKDLLNQYKLACEDMATFVKKSPKKGALLNIGVPPMLGTFLIPTILEKFSKVYPNVEVQLSELGSVATRKAILENEIALGLTVLEEHDSLGDKLVEHFICNTTLLYVVNKRHWLAGKKSVDLNDIKYFPLILMKEDCLQSSLVQKAFEEERMVPNIRIRTNQIFTIRELLTKNNLSAFIFNQLIKDDPALVGIPLKKPINLKIVAAYRKDIPLNDITQQFLDFLKTLKLDK